MSVTAVKCDAGSVKPASGGFFSLFYEGGGPVSAHSRTCCCWPSQSHQGAKVPLQRVSLTIPGDSDIGGLTFVLRSADATRW